VEKKDKNTVCVVSFSLYEEKKFVMNHFGGNGQGKQLDQLNSVELES